MFSMIKTTLVTAIVLGSASLAPAQGFDPNLANRYPGYADPGAYGYSANANVPARLDPAPHQTFQSAPVRLHQGRNAAQTGGPENWSVIDSNDRRARYCLGVKFRAQLVNKTNAVIQMRPQTKAATTVPMA